MTIQEKKKQLKECAELDYKFLIDISNCCGFANESCQKCYETAVIVEEHFDLIKDILFDDEK